MIALKDFPWQMWSIDWRGKRLQVPVAAIIGKDRNFNIYDVRSVFPDVIARRRRPLDRVIGFAMHHDGVLFSGNDANFNGHTLDESFDRLNAIYQHALAQGWGCMPYHSVHDLEGRIFIVGTDVLDTQRAHVAGYNPANNVYWNETFVGGCLMGNYADAKDPQGQALSMVHDRPPPLALESLDAWFQYATNVIGKPQLELRPHKWFGQFPGQDWKPCPGDLWVDDNAWTGTGFYYKPRTVTEKPNEPAPPVQPAPDPKDLWGVADGKELQDALDNLEHAKKALDSMKRRH